MRERTVEQSAARRAVDAGRRGPPGRGQHGRRQLRRQQRTQAGRRRRPPPVSGTAIELLDYRPNPSARALRKGSDRHHRAGAGRRGQPVLHRVRLGHRCRGLPPRAGADDRHRRGHDLESRDPAGRRPARPSGRRHHRRQRLPPARRDLPPVLPAAARRAAGHVRGRARLRGVGLDGAQGARLAVEHLGARARPPAHRHRARRRERTTWRTRARSGGAARCARPDSPTGPVVRVPWTRDGGYEAGRPAARLPRPADGGLRLQRPARRRPAPGRARARRLALPGDLAVVSFDGTKEAEYSWPPLTVVAQPIAEMARAAVSLALDPARPTPLRPVPGDAGRPALLRLRGGLMAGRRRPLPRRAGASRWWSPRRVLLVGAELGARRGIRGVLDHRAYVTDLRLDAALRDVPAGRALRPGAAGRPRDLRADRNPRTDPAACAPLTVLASTAPLDGRSWTGINGTSCRSRCTLLTAALRRRRTPPAPSSTGSGWRCCAAAA